MLLHKSILLAFLFNLLFFGYADPDGNCDRTSNLVDLESEFKMVQHQLRGYVKILDDCSFRVSQFDMLSGSDVHWWGAVASDFENFTGGFIVSDHKLNDTYKNASFVVRLMKNISWDMIDVLAVWDLPTASDFGHVLLRELVNNTASSASLAPSPSSNADNGTEVRNHTEPTIFENCKVLSKNLRVRWTLNVMEDFIDIGLEAATGIMNYMAFGWKNPDSTDSDIMIGADVAVTGFKEDGLPFVDDFYITKYSECVKKSDGLVEGVCPDSVYEGGNGIGVENNTNLIYGHRKDGVSFIRYRRPLIKVNKKYDHPVNHTANMTVIWAMGLIKPPDSIWPYYLPQTHGGTPFENYGYLVLNVSQHLNDCLGPMDAEDKEDQDIIIADAKVPLMVSSAPALHYPNPPNPEKVLYINKKEAPVLRVERGVPVTFSIQAGHDVALYITSDPIGGNATLRNLTETIYAGGPEAEGVQASPTELVWAPDRNTPDHIYYHSLYEQKMGWRVEVVDGGLSDMYNNSVVLDDQQVSFFWTLSKDSISMAARAEKKSGYLAIGFGTGMVKSYAYVGWFDDNGVGRVDTYWIDGKDASSIHQTTENLTYVRCKIENGIITMEFTRPLHPSCSSHDTRPECKNIIDPTTPLKVVWAMGATWSNEHLSERNMHSLMSSRPIRVLLMRGSAEAEQDLLPVLAVHGVMMFLAWGILLPGGILAARYAKHLKGDLWYRIHVYLQYSGLTIILLALLFAVGELRGFYVSSLHVKIGIAAIFLACIQPMNAYIRPQKPNGEHVSLNRIIWEYFHINVGRSAIIIGIAALFTGMKHLGDRYGAENIHGLNWALVIWFIICALMVAYLEYREKQIARNHIFGRSNWVFGNLEAEDSLDLLSPTRVAAEAESRMEVQLEPLNR